MSKSAPSGWIKASVIEVTDIKTGKLDANAANSNGAYPFFTCAEDESRINTYSFDAEAVLLAGNGFFGVKWYKGKFDAYQRTYVICPVGINGRFLYYTILWLIPTISEKSRGSTIKYLRLGDIQDTELLLPPLPEQTRIVAKLEELISDLDAGVAELKAAQKKLVQYRQSLLKAAVDGSLTAEWRKNNPPTETGAELLERILKERRTRWEAKQLAKFKEQDKAPPKDWQKKYPSPVEPDTTHLPELPTSWIWASVDQSTAESFIGLDRGQEQQSSTAAFGYIKMNNVSMHGNIDLKNITRVNATPEEVDKYSVALNDVLFNTRNSLELVGKTGLVGTLDGITLYNNNLMRLRFDGVLKPAFACFQMCGPEFRSRLERVKKATTSVAAVYAKDLFPLAMAIPPINEQNEILRILDLAMAGISTQQFEIERSLKQATAQRQNIFRAAFAGQLVPQDPNDEPASVLLERIRAERAAQAEPKARGRKKVAA